MRKLLVLTACLFTLTTLCQARGREGYTVKPVYTDNGDIIETYNMTVGTTTPIQIFFSTWTQNKNFRELMYQNSSTNTFRVYIGTHSAVADTSGGRWFIPGGGTWTTHAKDNLWAIFERAATGSLEVLGEFERDVLDENVTNR